MGAREWVEPAAGLLVTVTVAAIGAAAGFTHTHDAAVRAGQTGWLAWADAVVIECMALVAGWQLHRDRKAGRPTRFPAVVLVVAVLIQMGAQVSGAPATPAGWLFAAVPALACLVIVKLAMRSTASVAEQPAEVPTARSYPVVERLDEPAAIATPAPAWPPRGGQPW
jgi:hypothetical protein